MAEGPGKYDDITTYVREQTEAAGVIVIVIGGKQGHGFSAQFHAPIDVTTRAGLIEQQATVLRQVADQMEKDAAQLRYPTNSPTG